jgi:hypothetical protein
MARTHHRRVLVLACALSLSCAIDAVVRSHILARPLRASALHRSPRVPRRASAIVASDEGGGGDDDLEIMIWIEDPERKSVIRCYMESSTEFEGNRYALAHPVDIPVIVATCDDEEEGLHALESDDQIDAVFDVAKDVLQEEGFELKRSAYMLTVEEDTEAFDLDEIEGDDAAMYDDDDDEGPDFDEVDEGAEVSPLPHASPVLAARDRCEPSAPMRACGKSNT